MAKFEPFEFTVYSQNSLQDRLLEAGLYGGRGNHAGTLSFNSSEALGTWYGMYVWFNPNYGELESVVEEYKKEGWIPASFEHLAAARNYANNPDIKAYLGRYTDCPTIIALNTRWGNKVLHHGKDDHGYFLDFGVPTAGRNKLLLFVKFRTTTYSSDNWDDLLRMM